MNGKWEPARPIYDAFQAIMESNGFKPLPITLEHGLQAAKLPTDHRDPYDRILAAQAISEHLDVVTIDKRIGEFGAKAVW